MYAEVMDLTQKKSEAAVVSGSGESLRSSLFRFSQAHAEKEKRMHVLMSNTV